MLKETVDDEFTATDTVVVNHGGFVQ